MGFLKLFFSAPLSMITTFFNPVMIKAVLIAFVIGAAVGGYGAWKVHSWMDAAAREDALVKALKVEAADQAASQVVDKKIVATSVKIQKQTSTTNRELVHAIAQAETDRLSHLPVPDQNPADPANATALPGNCGAVALPTVAVGLLNRALDPASADPAGWSDAEKQTPSDVGLLDLSLTLNEVAGICTDLGQRHDALVEWVEGKMKAAQDAR